MKLKDFALTALAVVLLGSPFLGWGWLFCDIITGNHHEPVMATASGGDWYDEDPEPDVLDEYEHSFEYEYSDGYDWLDNVCEPEYP